MSAHLNLILLTLLSVLLKLSFSADLSMIEVYGKPATFKGVRTNSSLTWRNCMALCLKTPMCVLAYNKTGCQWFAYTNITAVNQTTAKDGFVVAFKVANSAGICPTGSNPPTFNNQNSVTNLLLYNGMSVNPVNVTYTISYSKKVWKISFTSKGACPSDLFIFFPRPKMGWCFQLLYSTGAMTYARSLELCTDYKTTLSGAMTASEVSWFLASATSIRNYTPKPDIVVRLAGVRSSTCQSTPATATCKTAQGFTFTDKNIDTIDKYSWMTNPGAKATSDSNCLVLVVKGKNAIKADVQSCSTATTLPAYGAMCGRQAWVW